MPSSEPFHITLSDLNYLLDQMRDAIYVIEYDAEGHAIYGFRDSSGVVHKLGQFGQFHLDNAGPLLDPLQIIDPVTGLSIYDGPREASGFRIPVGFFNNLVDSTRWKWGSEHDPFPRLTQADYDHYVQQQLNNAALTNPTGYVASHPGVTDPNATTTLATPQAYADVNKSVVDYTPRMITQTISSSYADTDSPASATGGALVGTDDAATMMSDGGSLTIDVDGTAVVFDFYDGAAHIYLGSNIGIDVRSTGAGHLTIADALNAIQAGLRAHGGPAAADATVGIDGGVLKITLGTDTDGQLTITDNAGLCLTNGTYSPTGGIGDSALDRTGVATDIFTETVTDAHGNQTVIEETVVRNQNTLPGDPSTSGIFTLFGQFFDHGLDFIDKGGQNSKIIIPLAPTDPLYRAPNLAIGDPGNTTITVSRATPDGYTIQDIHGHQVSIAGADGVWGATAANPTGDDVLSLGANGVLGGGDDVLGVATKPAETTYTNHTSPYIDQSQSYGSDTQITRLLREWVQDPNTGAWKPGAELLDGHQIKVYNSEVFNDAGAGQTTRTLPTLNELRAHLEASGRGGSDALNWDDINNYRTRDDAGHVIDTNGAAVGGNVFTGQALLLDMNPHFDNAHITASAMNQHLLADYGTLPSTVTPHYAVTSATATNPASGFFSITYSVDGGAPVTETLAQVFNFATNDFYAGVTDVQRAVWGEALMESVGDHYIAGDGRANENFGLTSLHHVFHENHNVQLLNLESRILGMSDADVRHGFQELVNFTVAATGTAHVVAAHYEDASGNTVSQNTAGAILIAAHYEDANHNYTTSNGTVSWDADKMFEATKLINEMEYQHVAIDQYARLVTPDLPEFVTYDSDINADISLEYAQAAFRFGHSQLRETVDAIDPNGMVTKFLLSGAFLNPAQFAATGAADILRGMSQQLSNEVDEFLTPAMQQSLLGQPLDLGAINIARGRDLGLPTLNETRRQLHDALVAERAADPQTPHHTNLIVDALNPYTSWLDFGSQMLHPESLVNFIAAYAFDGNLSKAQAIIGLESGTIAEGDAAALGFTLADAIGFLNDSYSGSNSELSNGADAYNDIDLWIGGLAEVHVFTGQVGSTFNAIFEDQMERLMDGDRFYYIYRLGMSGSGSLLQDTDLGHEIVTEQFKDIIERTTGVKHLNGDVMGYADSYIELGKTLTPDQQWRAYKGEVIHNSLGQEVTANQGDIKYEFNGSAWVPMIIDFKNAHNYGDLVSSLHLGIYSGPGGGTAGNGQIIEKSNTDLGIDHQHYIMDVRPNLGANDDGTDNQGFDAHEVLSGTDYNDFILTGNGDDTAYGDKGDDVLDGGGGADHLYGGDGQDVLYGGDIEDFIDGGAGDDILYGGTSSGAIDVVIGGDGNDSLYGEAGIDEMYGGAGDDYIDAGGDTDIVFGDTGNDLLYGGDGPDELRGGDGDDILSGGSGPDMLKGERGDDIMLPGIGQSAQQGDSDEALGDIGFDIASWSDLSIALDVAADLRNNNLTAAGGGVPFNPFNALLADVEGLIGSKSNDIIIGADTGTAAADGTQPGDNWLIGGGGDDTFNTRTPDATDSMGSGGNDVIIGDSIRLDALIGKVANIIGDTVAYKTVYDTLGNAVHLVGETLVGGLLGGAETAMFAKHFTDLIKTERNKDFVLGDDAVTHNGGTGVDTAIFQGNLSDYHLYAIDALGNIVANPHGHWSDVMAVKVVDSQASRTLADGITVVQGDGTDLLIGVEKFAFADQTINPEAYFDIAPTVDLNYVATPDVLTVASDNFNGNGTSYGRGTGWAGNWTEVNDGGSPSNGDITDTNDRLNFGNTATFGGGNASIDGDESISRAINLSGLSNATLSFSYNVNDLEAAKSLTVEAWNAATSSWNQIGSFIGTDTGGGLTQSGTLTVALTAAQISATSQIRFSAHGAWSGNDQVWIDNVQITSNPGTFHDGAPGNNYSTSYTEQLTPASIVATPVITDPDDATVASAKIVIRDAVTGDRLNVGSLPPGITATGNGTTTVVLSGIATKAAYQAALAAITFSNPTNDNPTNADRHIDVTVNDGLKDSAVATTTVHVTPVDDPAILIADTVVTNVGLNTNFSIPDWALLANDSDPDGTMSISGIGNGSGIQTSQNGTGHSNETVTVRDTIALGGTFTYSVQAPGTDPSTTVTVQQTTGNGVTVSGDNITDSSASHIIVGNGNANVITGNGGNDIVFGNGGDDTITTAGGNDYIDGGSGADSMTGGDGNDTYVIDDVTVSNNNPATRDRVLFETANGGTDTVQSSSVSLNLNDTAFDNVENATLTGNSNLNLTGDAGNNVLTGNTGSNTIIWNALGGRDTVDGGGGTDTFVINGNNSAETFNIYAMTNGQNSGLAGQLGTTFAADTEIVITRTVAGVTSVVAELDNIDEITINTLNVTANNNNGGLDGGVTGGDTVVINGNFNATDLNFSTITVNGSRENDKVDLSHMTSAHHVVFHGNGGNDTVIGEREQDDIKINKTLVGTAAADKLNGGDGDDLVYGRGGRDVLRGGDGDDKLFGGALRDSLWGGDGHDTFCFRTVAETRFDRADVINDFHTREDRFDFSAIDANVGRAGNQAFSLSLKAGADFTAAGQLRYHYQGTGSHEVTIVEGNVNSDLGADFQVVLRGHVALHSTDFIL
jgi:Ca2+-binding RTX toxin-like protein